MLTIKKNAGNTTAPPPPWLPDRRQIETRRLLARLSIKRFDALLVGDGSGSQWGHAAGWASFLIRDRGNPYPVTLWSGAVNQGTNNFAELSAYVAPLNWLWQQEEKRRRRGTPTHVHIVTDSQYVANAGNRKCGREAQGPLWASFDFMAARGFIFKWHWLPRNETLWNYYADFVSKAARQRLNGYNLLEGALR